MTNDLFEPNQNELAILALDSLLSAIAVLNEMGEILLVNKQWHTLIFLNQAGHASIGVGKNYLTYLQTLHETTEQISFARQLKHGLQTVLTGNSLHYSQDCPMYLADKQRWARIRATRFVVKHKSRIVLIFEETSEGKTLDPGIISGQEPIRTEQWNLEKDADHKTPLLSRQDYAPDIKPFATEDFLTKACHEIKTPLTMLSLLIESFTHYYEQYSEDQRKAKLVDIKKHMVLLADVVMSFMENRHNIRANRSIMDQVSIVDTLRNMAYELEPLLTIKRLRFSIDADPHSIIISAQYVDISLIWRNLLSNAIKYTGNDGSIDVHLFLSNSSGFTNASASFVDFIDFLPPDFSTTPYLVGLVEDSGIGIAQAHLPRLFTRYFRGDAAIHDIPGTGLGLAFTRDVIRNYQGDITVKSELNVGTKVCFWLPSNPSNE